MGDIQNFRETRMMRFGDCDVTEPNIEKTRVMIAVESNNLEMVKSIVHRGFADIQSGDPILYAARKGYVDIVEFLHNCGADEKSLMVVAKKINRNDPVCEEFPPNAIQFLINEVTRKKSEILRRSLMGFTTPPSSLQIRRKMKVPYRKADGMSALHCACVNDHHEIVEMLIKSNANVNAVDDHGRSPLDVCEITSKSARVLRQNGAKHSFFKKGKDFKGNSVSDAMTKKIREMKESLMLSDAVKNFEQAVCNNDRKAAVELMEKHGKSRVDVNDEYLQCAASCNACHIIEYLREEGADLDQKDDNGMTALHVAAQYGHLDTFQLLMRLGASSSVSDTSSGLFSMGFTPFHWCCIGCIGDHSFPSAVSVLYFLRDLSVRPNQVCRISLHDAAPSGVTALHIAIMQGNFRLIKWLVEFSVNVNKNSDWPSPLHCAVDLSISLPPINRQQQLIDIDIVRFLVSRGADINYQNEASETMYDILKSRCDDELYKKNGSIQTMYDQLVEFAESCGARPGIKELREPCTFPVQETVFPVQENDNPTFVGKLVLEKQIVEEIVVEELAADNMELRKDDHCDHCLVPSSATLRLKRCSFCFEKKYCSTSCLMESWSLGHKDNCRLGQFCGSCYASKERDKNAGLVLKKCSGCFLMKYCNEICQTRFVIHFISRSISLSLY